ncbi:LADA_0F10572g1_1 [Lachancea dasiensis]|uniref:protein-tyrosine-phosphatase n=1 Tax=Lachancea dasiensis TaxID=1072105 RepID=A0A1G4JLP9_9SACH|nr:LADA_0F10572g1_1 [Lachancea dasiensis]
MGASWGSRTVEAADKVSHGSSAISSSPPRIFKSEAPGQVGSVKVIQPHRRAVSALTIDYQNGASMASSQGSQATVVSPSAPRSSSLPFLMRSNSNPSLPSFKPKETRLPRPDGTSSISANEFRTLLQTEPTENLIIMDVRPFVEYSRSTLKNALHVCLPSTLLRRKTFTLERLVENLPDDVRSVLEAKVLEPSDCSSLKIVIFDNASQAPSNSSVSIACHGMASKFANSDRWSTPSCRPTVFILHPGFPAVKELDSSLAFTAAGTCLPAPSDVPQSPRHLDTTSYASPNPKHLHHSNSISSPSSLSDYPLSSSSPLSALLKFQLPSTTGTPPPFKLPRHEEVSNLESYLSAVNLGERQRSVGGSSISPSEKQELPTARLDNAFKFPAASTKDNIHPQRNDDISTSTKLKFQKSFLHMQQGYGDEMINSVIPKWFQDLANGPKLDMVVQFQKIDLLEKSRLSYCLANSGLSPDHSTTSSSSQLTSVDPIFVDTEQCPAKWLDEYDSDEEDQSICISSGVELGSKNRYKDIFPYEHTRVILQKDDTTFESAASEDITETYINANYLVNPFIQLQGSLKSTCKNVRYIATQAPLAATTYDFYTCILNNNVPLILSLTDEFENGVEKCFKFWAEGDYDGIQIRLLAEQEVQTSELESGAGSVTIRRIQIRQPGGRVFETLQAQIKNWPDLGVMVNPRQILELICLKNVVVNELFEKQVYANGYLPTILVHCSAGCGRTGTLCALDSVLNNASKIDGLKQEWAERRSATEVNPWSPRRNSCLDNSIFDPVIITINKFRKQRISMVQNVNQYLFIYDCLTSYFDLCMKAKMTSLDSSPIYCKSIKKLGIVQSFLDRKVSEP